MPVAKNPDIQSTKKNPLGIIIMSLILMVAIGAGITWVPSYVARLVVVSETERKAEIWQARVLHLLDEHGATFEKATLTEKDHKSLSLFVASSDAFRLRLFGEDGQLFWSSRTGSELGQSESSRIADEEFFKNNLRHGVLYHHTGTRQARFVDGYAEEHIGSAYDDNETRITSEIYIPVVHNGRTIGVVEHYRDITDALNISEFRLLIATIIISVALIVMWATALLSVLLFKKRSQGLLDLQRAQEQASAELELQRNREIRLLSELNEWLQSCQSLDELYQMVSSILARMFPDSSGSLYVYSNSRDVLEGACNWHGGRLEEEIRPDDCWGLRRGRTYSFGSNEIDFVCNHADEDGTDGYICIPIVAHGDTIGLMHFVSSCFGSNSGDATEQRIQERKLAMMCAEQISLAIANVRLRDQLHSQSIRDSLTGLYNRRHFTDSCRKQITVAKRRGEQFGLISLDVDHFKLFNDNHGHDAGDMVLRAVGEVLQREFDGNDLPCRTGGEEFTVLLPDLDEKATIVRAERLRKLVEEIVVRYGDHALPRVTISAGVSIYPDHGDMPQTLVKSADEAMYVSKGLGRNQVSVAKSDAQERTGGRVSDFESGSDPLDKKVAYEIAAE